MFLEKIEIQGFKSFAKKTVLKFAHEESKNNIGLTVIVGPNGSGKSNIADAVRWVLGEQSVKMLRGKKSEDVIFAGSNKKSSLSFAEVSLYLNNEDKKAPVDYTQMVVTRRLYRDGESEYLLNNNKIRLIDMQLLLAKARFGQRAYSVVGQGMVENFLNTTPSERKEFFDEATGVKMYQIKKHEASNKLKNAQNNLEQAENLLNEIEPRMKSLTRQIKKLEKRNEIETELKDIQKNYYAQNWHDLNGQLKDINKRVAESEEKQRAMARELTKLNEELTKNEREQYNTSKKEDLEVEQKKLRSQRDALGQKLAEVKAQKNVSLEMSGRSDEAWLNKQKDEIARELSELEKELKNAQDKEVEANKQVVSLRREQNSVDERIVSLRREIISYHSGDVEDSKGVVSKIKEILKEVFSLQDEIDKDIADAKEISVLKKHFASLRKKIETIKNLAEEKKVRDDADLEKINSEIINLEEEKNTLTENYIKAQSRVATSQSDINRIKGELANARAKLEEVNKKLSNKKTWASADEKTLDKKEDDLVKKIKNIDSDLEKVADEIKAFYDEEKKQRDVIISLQKKAHALQDEYNKVAAVLSEAQVEKARIETKLEDLESEIRRETNNLRGIIDYKNFHKIERGEAQEQIQKLKRQLELIGGIDPEIQKEYSETKERYDFLQNQATDLRAAITALQKVISTLEKTISEKFDKAFSEIAKQFEKYFKILFDGGSVKLEKIMEEEKKADEDLSEDEIEDVKGNEEGKRLKVKGKSSNIELRKVKKNLAGIDVMACPPNKKIKHISTLSGGERALTSIALIAAIIAVNPSPFVMLDEVDAALDEANSVRLSRILEDLSKKTQFIAITHNRTIMYRADIIYGVTMGDDGISKLLSVKVEDVKGARR